jgi:hypothetical protein
LANRINVDGIIVESGGSIRDVLELAGREDAIGVVTTCGEVITPRDYDRPAPPHGMVTNCSPIEKGASLRQRLLARECELIDKCFLQQFPDTRRSLKITENTLLVRNFPLPDDYTPDHVDLLIVTWGYPDVPPAGVHIPSTSPHRDQIDRHLGGHLYSSIPSSLREHVEELTEYGWDWVCYHYANWSWRLNTNNLLAGDCLYKYVGNVFAALSGGHR